MHSQALPINLFAMQCFTIVRGTRGSTVGPMAVGSMLTLLYLHERILFSLHSVAANEMHRPSHVQKSI